MVRFISKQRNIRWLDAIQEGETIVYRFTMMHIRYTPTCPHFGKVEFKGDVRSVVSAYSDYLHLRSISKFDKSVRGFNISEEVRDYEIMQRWSFS